MSRLTCPHNLIGHDEDTDEYWCEDCGDTVDIDALDDEEYEE